MPDDSCTGVGCHVNTASQRDWLQSVITTRQTVILDKLDQALALQAQASALASQTVAFKKASVNVRFVRNDGSLGIHNYYYARDLLDAAIAAYDAIVNPPVPPGAIPVSRISGANRYETDVVASQNTFESSSCANIVLATGQDFPDALSAAGLAGAFRSPVLLTPTASLNTAVDAEIYRLSTKDASGNPNATVNIVGGTGAVSAAVQNALTAQGYTIVRFAGTNRYATAQLVAAKVRQLKGGTFSRSAFVADGTNFPDALAAGPLAYQGGWVVLLTQPTALPAETAAAITGNGIDNVAIVGGTGAVSAGVQAQIASLSTTPTIVRLQGPDRYSTAIQVAQYGTAIGTGINASVRFVGVAQGTNFPDALGASAPVGERGGVLVLTQPTALPTVAANYLWDNNFANSVPSIDNVWIFGGTAAVSDSVRTRIYDLVNDNALP
jgi:putative cell wall-binding protein